MMMVAYVPRDTARATCVAAGIIALSLVSARAGERDALNACKTMVANADKAGAPPQDDAALQRCRLVIKDWTLRDSRMIVDEEGRPLK